MRDLVISCLVAAAVLAHSTYAFAHHGTNASYDSTKPITLTGVVTKFTFRNPHAYIEFDVKNENGELVHWVGEMNSPTVLKAAGWTDATIKAGDELTMTLNPSRAGTPRGVVNRMRPVFANGKQLLGTGGSNEN
jgi:hypothetical protein